MFEAIFKSISWHKDDLHDWNVQKLRYATVVKILQAIQNKKVMQDVARQIAGEYGVGDKNVPGPWSMKQYFL